MTRVKSGYFGHQDPVVRSSIKFDHGLSVNQSFNSHSPKMGTITREKSKKKVLSPMMKFSTADLNISIKGINC